MIEINNVICLLVGPSGSGKTTIADKLADEKGWKVVESYTTRPKRYPKETGHIFVAEEDFEQYKHDLCAYTEFDGHKYWATNQQVDESDLYIIDPAGVMFFLESYKGRRKPIIAELVIDKKTCKERMQKRGDSEAAIKRRIKHDEKAFKHILSDFKVDATNDLENIVWQIVRNCLIG